MSSAAATAGPWLVCQLGARMHYAIPRFLYAAGQLERLHTDLYARRAHGAFAATLERFLPTNVRRFAERSAAIPDQLVRDYPSFGLAYHLKRRWAADVVAANKVYLWAGESFGRRVVNDGFGHARGVYAFNTAALEIFRAAGVQGIRTVLEQTIAPRAIEEALLLAEHQKYPDWEPTSRVGHAVGELIDREAAEWELADVIVCGSSFVRDGIEKCAGPVNRCRVVPYGVELSCLMAPRSRSVGPLKVLTVGHVGLRKGAPYVLETARRLAGNAEFRWVGPSLLSASALAKMSASIDCIGAVPRSEVQRHYDWADIFFLPSVCEGSATVTYEALVRGLPVVTTPNAGSTVIDGVNGFIVGHADVAAMADCLERFRLDDTLLGKQSRAALDAAADLSLDSYRSRLLDALGYAGGRDV